jgi:uncharacterized YigZ family protein
MQKITKELQIEIIEKKSKFITRSRIVSSEEKSINLIKEIVKLEKGATHNCFAYRILTDKKTIIERKNDDGEPGGTAGAPMLSVLAGENLVNILIITTRYFGGIKLGTGGLVNVYKRGAVEVIKESGIEEYKVIAKYKIIFPINQTNYINYIIGKQNIKVIDKFFEENVTYIVEIAENETFKLENIKKIIPVTIENI